MTKVARLYEEEKIEAVNEAVNKAREEADIEKKDTINSLTKKLLTMNMDILDIMKVTGLTKKEIEKLMEQ